MAAQKNPSSDDLANIIADTINKKFKTKGVSFKTAYYLTDPEVISDVTDFVSTGSSMLDIAISNRPGGGIPVGRITEIFGMEASGKSLLGAQIIAQTQKKGGLGIYIDTEAAISREFYQALGVDVDKMLYLPIDSLEDIFEAIEAMISSVRNNDKKRLVTIVVDSIMGSSTKKELEGDYDKEGWNTDKAIILSKAMRKLPNLIAYQNVALVFTNQLRSKLGVSFGDPWTTSGGKAVPFASSVRIRLKSLGQITLNVNNVKQVVGIKTRAQVVKNRMGPPFKAIDYDIYFDSGIDDYGSWLSVLKEYNIVSVAGAWYSVKMENPMEVVNPESGEVKSISELKFQSKNFGKLIDANPELKSYLYNLICEKFIMKYRINEDYGVDDVEMVEGYMDED